MKKTPLTTDITGELILLGTGTSVGVPALGCHCPVCTGGHPRNQRTRCSAILGLPGGNLLIDTSPDLRTQLLREKIGIVHAVVYTHEHSDHIMGFDDLRLFQFYLGHPVPVFCNATVAKRLHAAFEYAFDETEGTHPGSSPSVDMRLIDREPFSVLGETVIPIPLKHGPRFDVLGFRIGNIAYCTDTNEIPESSWPLLEGLDALILDGLRETPHPTHFTLEEAVEVSQRLNVPRTWLTHSACSVDYERTNAWLPEGIDMAYDGLRIPLS